jgi:hypothetical protein
VNQFQETVSTTPPSVPAEIVLAGTLEARPEQRPVKQIQRGRLMFQAPTMQASDFCACEPCCIFFCVYYCVPNCNPGGCQIPT